MITAFKSIDKMHYREVMMSSEVYDRITDMIVKSYPNACLLYIDEIVNDELYSSYVTRKTLLEGKRGDGNIKELQLFHGTKVDSLNSIAQTGFQKAFNKTSAYGKGTYFSTTASYSTHYTDKDNTDVSFMFVCDVIVGNCTVVNGPIEIDTIRYDNSVNNVNAPTIYVTPYDDGAYPRYLVAFHKNPK